MDSNTQRYVSLKVFAVLIAIGIVLGLAYYFLSHRSTKSVTSITTNSAEAPTVFSGTITKFEQGVLTVRDVSGTDHTFTVTSETRIRAANNEGKFELADQSVLSKNASVLMNQSVLGQSSASVTAIDVITAPEPTSKP